MCSKWKCVVWWVASCWFEQLNIHFECSLLPGNWELGTQLCFVCMWVAYCLWLWAWRWQRRSQRGPGHSWRRHCISGAGDPPGQTGCPAAQLRMLRRKHHLIWYRLLLFTRTHMRSLIDLQLMNQIVAIVTEKKRSSPIGTLTSTAVRMKSSRIKTRLPAMRIASDILGEEIQTSFNQDKAQHQAG